MISFLRNYGGQVFLCLGVLGVGFSLGVATTNARLMPKIAEAERKIVTISLAFSEAQRTAAEQHNDALKAVVLRQQELYDFSEQILTEYHRQADELETLKQQRDRSIPYAVSRDGQAFTGLGPDGLRLYTSALGYLSITGDNRLPPYPDNADSDTGAPVTTDVGHAPVDTDARERLRTVGDEAGETAHPDTPVGPRTEQEQ